MAYTYTDRPQSEIGIGRVVKRVFGVAALLALPGIWVGLQGAAADTQIMGLGVSIALIGLAGLCLFRRG